MDDSQQHRHLSAELVSADQQALAFEQLDIPWVRRPLAEQLSELTTELNTQWLAFDHELRAGQLTHLDYDEVTAILTCRRHKAEDDDQQDALYEQLSFCDMADVLRFVNKECQFLSALKPLQPRYARQVADEDSLLAVIAAHAMNHGNLLMSRTSDIPYHVLEATYQQYLHTLRYLRDPTLQRHVHRSQNRLESYHQLRSAIAQVGGKKELTGRTDLEIEISNQCARLVANAIVFYNSAILSRLLTRYEASGNERALALVTSASPVAWRHVHLNGRYAFRGSGQALDLDAIIQGLDLE